MKTAMKEKKIFVRMRRLFCFKIVNIVGLLQFEIARNMIQNVKDLKRSLNLHLAGVRTLIHYDHTSDRRYKHENNNYIWGRPGYLKI